MKKILGILGTITIAGSGMAGLVGNAPAPAKNNEINYLQTNNLETLKRNKRELIHLYRVIPTQMNINLPNGFTARNNPPSKQDIIQAIHYNSNLPADVANMLNIFNITRRSATVSINDYYYNGDTYTGSQTIYFN